MEFQIQRRDLLKGLTHTHGIADRKSSMPILSNVLLDCSSEGTLRFSATDLYLGITSVAECQTHKPGTISLPARTFFDIVKNLPDGEVSCSVGDNQVAEIRAGKVEYRISSMSGDDFPPLPLPADETETQIPLSALRTLIHYTHYSMSHDDTRPHLSGALLQVEPGTLRMVTTDGHRLSKAEVAAEGLNTTFDMLIPHKGIAELRRLVDEGKGNEEAQIGITSSAGNGFFRIESLRLNVKLTDEPFPPYDKVIPSAYQKRVIIDRQELAAALRRISLVSRDKSSGIQVEIGGDKVRIRSQDPDVGEAHEDIDASYDGDPITIGFNARYLLDVLAALPHDEVALELSGELDPGVIRPASDGVDYVGVVMPVRF